MLVAILDDLSLKYKEKKPFRIIEEERIEDFDSEEGEEDEDEEDFMDKC